MESKDSKINAIKAINEWGKLLVGLNAGMGGACLAILQNSSAVGLTRVFLVSAVIMFVASMLFSVLLMGQALVAITGMAEQAPTIGSLYRSRGDWSDVVTRLLARLQLISFVLACLFLGVWVALKLT